MGTLLQTKLFKGRMHFKGPEDKKVFKVLGRAFFLAIVAIVIFLPVYLIVNRDDNVYVRLVVQVFVPLTVAMIIIFGLMDQFFFKIKLYEPDDLSVSILY